MRSITSFSCNLSNLCVVFAFALLTHVANGTPGQPGTLDTTWGSSGKAITAVGSSAAAANAVVVQPDGKVILAGYCRVILTLGTLVVSDSDDFCALRYLANGTVDTSYGESGVAKIGSGQNLNDRAYAAALDRNGKLVLAGTCGQTASALGKVCVARVNTDGTVDSSIGVNGIGNAGIALSVAAAGEQMGFVIQNDGKYVIASGCANSSDSFCAIRFDASGQLDTSFGGTGIVSTPVGASPSVVTAATAIAQQVDNKLVLVGRCIDSSNATLLSSCVLRYNENGTLDTSFGPNNTGVFVIPKSNGEQESASGVAIQADGKILVIATCATTFCAARYNPNGTADSRYPKFKLTGTANYPQSVVLQADGLAVLGGFCSVNSDEQFCIARALDLGFADYRFGDQTPYTYTSIGSGADKGRALAIQSDGKILLAGTCTSGSPGKDHFCAARYDGGPFNYRNCSLDIDGDNKVLATTDSLIHARLALGMTGSAVIAGINFPTTATRKTWPEIREYLITQCGLSIAP